MIPKTNSKDPLVSISCIKFPDIIKPNYETENQWVKGR